MTDVNLGDLGHNERIAFVFDTDRTIPSGLACELVIPPEWVDLIPIEALRRQFARTPYAVSFRTRNETVILATLHVIYKEDLSTARVTELEMIAKWMAEWADRENRFHHNMLTLGDFNIDRKDSDQWKAFTSTGLRLPPELENLPRTIFTSVNNPKHEKFYDQVAWFVDNGNRQLTMDYKTGGNFDFRPFVYTEFPNMTNKSLSYRVSDHFPLWVEFTL